ncbi:MAG: hypothetical protein SGARI_000160 [Bacillariaceae sp.]
MRGNQKILFTDIFLPREILRDELDASQVLGQRLQDKLASIVRITDANRCGFQTTADPHGFVYGGQLIIASCLKLAQDLVDFFVRNVTEPHREDLCCPHENNACRSLGFSTWMDVDHHVSNNCLGLHSEELAPIHERNCNFQNIGWCIKDRYVRLLSNTDFGALGLPPQDLIDSNRKPYLYRAPSDVKKAEYDAAVNPKSSLLTISNFVCNHQDITTKTVFLAGLGLFKNLDQWSPGLLGKLEVWEGKIEDNWPEFVQHNIGVRKTARQLQREERTAKRLKRQADKAADLEKMRAMVLEQDSKKAASLKSPPGQDI